MPNEKYKYAGKKLKVKEGAGRLSLGMLAEGLIFEAEDYWINITGKSWGNCNGNPACIEYALRTATQKLKTPFYDDKVVYGKIDGFGHLFHESELELMENEGDL